MSVETVSSLEEARLDATISFRRLIPSDAQAVMALSQGIWWMEARDEHLVAALLSLAARHNYGLFDDGRLVATAALLTDGLTKATLVDVAVVADRRGEGLGDEVVARTMATVPDHIEGILYCRNDLAGFYEGHGFKVDSSYTLMLRR